MAFADHSLRADYNHGRPPVAATARAAMFHGHGAFAARAAGGPVRFAPAHQCRAAAIGSPGLGRGPAARRPLHGPPDATAHGASARTRRNRDSQAGAAALPERARRQVEARPQDHSFAAARLPPDAASGAPATPVPPEAISAAVSPAVQATGTRRPPCAARPASSSGAAASDRTVHRKDVARRGITAAADADRTGRRTAAPRARPSAGRRTSWRGGPARLPGAAPRPSLAAVGSGRSPEKSR